MNRPNRRSRKSGPPVSIERPWRDLTNPYRPIEPLSPEKVALIHRLAMEVLEDVGMRIQDHCRRQAAHPEKWLVYGLRWVKNDHR